MNWIALVNDAVRDLADLEPRDRTVLRQLLVRRLCGRFEFPLESGFAAVVKGDRRLRLPGGSGRGEADVAGDDAGPAERPFLELVPDALSPSAYEVLGGVLVGAADDDGELTLESGSIVEAVVELDDPDRYLIDPPAMMGRLEALDVKLRVGA